MNSIDKESNHDKQLHDKQPHDKQLHDKQQTIKKWSLSEEQKYIIDQAIEGHNLIVNAVAGSGKTTTIINLALQINKNIIMITYNRELADEVRAKTKHIPNIQVHTYHSLLHHYWGEQPYSYDHGIEYVLRNNKPTINLLNADILIIDEVQDMTPIYFGLARKVAQNIPQLLLFGDEKQCLYKFKNSNSNYLIFGDEIFQRQMKRCHLTVSYRITHPIASFINDVCIGKDYLKAQKPGPNIKYVVSDLKSYLGKQKLANDIYELIATRKYRPDDIFILMNSINPSQNHPLYGIENVLSERGIPIFVKPENDATVIPSDYVGKCVITTFCGSKGRERDLVIILGYDANYFQYIDKTANQNIIPNVFYVAITRAKQQLWLISNHYNKEMPYHKIKELNFPNYVDKVMSSRVFKPPRSDFNNKYAVQTLVSHLSSDLTFELEEQIEKANIITRYKKPKTTIDIPDRIHVDNTTEFVAHITGLYLPDRFVYKKTGKSLFREQIHEYYLNNNTYALEFDSPKHLEETKRLYKQKKSPYKFIKAQNSTLYLFVDKQLYFKPIYEQIAPRYVAESTGVKIVPYSFTNSLITFIQNNNLHQDIPMTKENHLKYVVASMAINRYHHKVVQVPRYEWITDQVEELALARLEQMMKDCEIKIEIPLNYKDKNDCIINGQIDMITSRPLKQDEAKTKNKVENKEVNKEVNKVENKEGVNKKAINKKVNYELIDDEIDEETYNNIDEETEKIMYEIKCVSELTLEHKLQLLVYMYIFNQTMYEGPYRYRLFNIKTDEILSFRYDHDVIESIFDKLVQNKIQQKTELSKKEFLKLSIESYPENKHNELENEHTELENNDDNDEQFDLADFQTTHEDIPEDGIECSDLID